MVDATDNNDTVTVDAAGNVTVLNRSTLATNTYAGATYTGLVIDVSGDNGIVNIATTLSYTGDAANPVNVNVDNRTIKESLDAVVTFTGLGAVDTSSGNALGVVFAGGTGADNLDVTPTGLGSALVQANGAGPMYDVTSAPALTEIFAGTGNTLAFNGNTAGETFRADAGTVGAPADIMMFYTPSKFSSIIFNGVGGNNSLTIDSSSGTAINAGIIVFNGGSGGGNSLTLS
ncbi:MAG: hypothetical protein B7Z73_00920, partial [Planctomycetia bacterium 21-64-5]